MQNLNTLLTGGADGKFAIPLAKVSKHLTVLECDESCFIDTRDFESLLSKLQRHELHNVDVLKLDFQSFQLQEPFDLIFTSCSRHYSRNKEFGVWSFIDKILSLSHTGSLLFPEKAHFAVPYDHTHKMGIFMGKIS
ncbi:hypothetical protein HC864_04380 [Candidatus Gracilibacteria bacterium]|nr:hypothetical protein [Candidatus Gracilibacteria bacterium]